MIPSLAAYPVLLHAALVSLHFGYILESVQEKNWEESMVAERVTAPAHRRRRRLPLPLTTVADPEAAVSRHTLVSPRRGQGLGQDID